MFLNMYYNKEAKTAIEQANKFIQESFKDYSRSEFGMLV